MRSPTTTKRTAWAFALVAVAAAWAEMRPASADEQPAAVGADVTPVTAPPATATPVVAAAAPTLAKKPWEVGAALESHGLLVRNDLQGAANNKFMNFLYLYGRYEPTAHDAIELRTYLYERFLADPGETGVRSDDTSLYFAHYFDETHGVKTRVFAALTAPTSFTAQKMSLYTAPRLGGAASWSRHGFRAEIIGLGEAFWVKYGQMVGGNPNPKTHLMAMINLEAKLGTLPLAVGVTGVTHRFWYYQAGAPPVSSEPFNGAVSDPQFANQPMQGSYGFQTFLRWELPDMDGISSDLTAAYAQGDSTLGYTSSLHDGITHSYLFWRTSSQFYGALSAKF